MTILVTAASKHGATFEIAERIGAYLTQRGLHVEVRNLADVDEIDRYEAVVLGSAIYFGKWMKEAIRFVEAHAGELAERPTWLFASGPIVGNPPPADDPNAIRPTLVESLVSSTQARQHKLFGGRIERSRLNLAERVPVRLVSSGEGDWRDFAAIDEWAAGIADELEPTRQRE